MNLTEENWLSLAIEYLEDYRVYLMADDEHAKEQRVERLLEYLNKTND